MYIYSYINSTYYNPHSTRQTILENTVRFIHAISKNIEQGSLSDGTVRIQFRHNVYRFLFHDKQQLDLEDFDSTYFSTGWKQTLRQYTGQQQTKYTGCRVVFPLDATLYLDYTKQKWFYYDTNGHRHTKKRTFVEMVRFKFIKEDFTHTVNS